MTYKRSLTEPEIFFLHQNNIWTIADCGAFNRRARGGGIPGSAGMRKIVMRILRNPENRKAFGAANEKQ